jgi:hypothetical protein
MNSESEDASSDESGIKKPNDLHPLDKLAIQSYMLKFVIPSAVALSIISAAIGFFVDRLGRNEAYMETYKEIEPKLIDAQARATTAVTKVEVVVSKTEENLKQQTEDISKQRRDLSQLISSAKLQSEDFSKSIQQNFEKIADAVVHKDEFRKEIFVLSQEELNKINTNLSNIASKQIIVGIDRIDSINIGGSPQTFVSNNIGYEPDFCALTKVEIGNIDSLCRVFKDGGAGRLQAADRLTNWLAQQPASS